LLTGPRERTADIRLASTIQGMEPLQIGVLVVQGNFREHAQMLRALGAARERCGSRNHGGDRRSSSFPASESTTFMR
jgi:hypothetical protein